MHLLLLAKSRQLLFIAFILLCLFTLSVKGAFAITAAKNTLTTSRPSPSSPLNAALGSTDTQATIFNNGSRFLASDSAKLIKTATTAVTDGGTIVASQSGDLTTVYFGEQAGVAGFAGADVLYVPITAMHTVEFNTGIAIPVSGIIRLTFPTLLANDADNDASPSATTFQFNNVVNGGSGTGTIEVWNVTDNTEITGNVTITEVEPSPGSGGIINITLDGSTSVDLGDKIRIFLGCTASTASACTAQAPRIINPTKTASVGVADSWKLRIDTRNASDVGLETATVGMATNESVTVRATVDPTLTFTITGINNGTDIGNGNLGCNNGSFGVNTSSGINSTANEVNLGVLSNTPTAGNTPTNIAAQLIQITTNGSTGYALTATSSSSLMNPLTGYFLLTQETPSNYAASSDFFGLHPCGDDVDDATWVEDSSANDQCSMVVNNGGGTTDECLWAWPNDSNTLSGGTVLSIASDTLGPVGTGTTEVGDGYTSVAYSAGIDVNVPPGEYRTVITYIATPSF